MPLAVSSGKMPVAAPKAAVKQKRRKGPDLRLCKRFQDTGNCTDPNCSLAHGAKDLEQRQMAARSVLLSDPDHWNKSISMIRPTCVMVRAASSPFATTTGASACILIGTLAYGKPVQ